MAEKKKQHFVSQFLLRFFSCDVNPELINFYNRKLDKLIIQTPINGQAQEKYYYGVDLTFENFLKTTEDRAAPIIKEIIETYILPERNDIRFNYLLHFIMLYAFRTKASVEHTEEYLNVLFKEIAKHDLSLQNIDLTDKRLVHPEPAAYNLASYMDNWVVGADLDACLIVNMTNKDFFISDNPLIVYNPLMLKRKCYWEATGLINKGLVLFFPISPKLYIMLYDRWAYDVLASGNRIDIIKSNDVYQMNLLQSISSDQFIYFPDTISHKYIKNLAIDGLKNKKDEIVKQYITHPETKRKFLLTYHLVHKLDLSLSFIREGTEASTYDVHSKMGHPRNQDLVDWIKMDKFNFIEKIRKPKEEHFAGEQF